MGMGEKASASFNGEMGFGAFKSRDRWVGSGFAENEGYLTDVSCLNVCISNGDDLIGSTVDCAVRTKQS